MHADDERRRRKSFLQGRVAADVVAMAVGVQNCRRDEFLIAEKIEDQLGLQSRVDDQSVAPSRLPDHVGVLGKGHRNDGVYLEFRWHGKLPSLVKAFLSGACVISADVNCTSRR